MKRFVGTAAAFTAALAFTGCAVGTLGESDRYQSAFHFTYDLPPGGRLNVDDFNGAIEITGWDRSKVEITGVKYASSQAVLDSLKIEIRNEPDLVDIRVVRPAESFAHAGARFSIRVPRKAALDRIGTSNGQIRISDVESGARLKTSNGAIRVDNLHGTIDAQTTNAAIEMHAIGGSAVMKTSNGRIHADGIGGECEASTSNGSIAIRLDDAPDLPLKATTSNGSIELTLVHAPKSDIRAKTSNGAITVHLPGDTAARLEADTTNSSITTELDVAGEANPSHRISGRSAHLGGTIGAGGPLIELATRNGHINLLRM